MKPPFAKKSWAIAATSLRTSASAPFPIALAVGEGFRDTIFAAIMVGLHEVGDDEFAG